jgi:hypothetical protein|tara:strand:+ start:4486 stop:6219 length:1734 start_codon:yes stop_codon:yes gene_type:complete
MNGEQVTYFAETDSRNKRTRFGIKAKDRTRHVYVIGKTGMGKSTLLENMAVQDIQNGEGFTFIDPHGASAEKLLDYVPEERINDVLYFAPFDMDYPVAFNIMEDVGAERRHLVVNGLMSVFEKIWVDQWSARMAYILQNTLLALLEYPNSTLLGVNRMYTDKAFRKKVVDNITDPTVKSFWVDEYATYTDRYTQEATPAIQNKVGQFASNPLIRNIIGQPKSAFDLRELMDNKKIVIANLAKGKVGEGNARLLGSMLITRMYLAALSRADITAAELKQLPNAHLFVDEFQSFADKSFENILSESRKYKLNLTVAHQYIEQMEEEVRAAVFGNIGTMITFRIGAYDAEVLEKEFAPIFYAQDLVNLGFAQIYLKLMIDGISSQPFSATTLPPLEEPHISHKDQIIAASRKAFAHPRGVVEDDILTWHAPVEPQKQNTEQSRNTNKRVENRRNERSNHAPVRSDTRQRDSNRRFERRPKDADSVEKLRHKMNTANRVKRNDDGKGPSESHMNELRSVLKSVVKDEDKNHSKQPFQKDSNFRNDNSRTENIEKTKQNIPSQKKEVPAEVLKKLLDVDDKK